ncbi:uncharacterized protein BDZ99DRAFT_353586, partial [Mytilinidion resinicola]
FGHPTTPWERNISTGPAGFNRMPWLAVLSFTEDELILDSASCEKAHLSQVLPSRYGVVTMTAKELFDAPSVASPLNQQNSVRNYEDNDPVDVLLLKPSVFQQLFSGVDEKGDSKWTGTADIARFAMMAHVRETHGGFMASTDASIPQPQFSVVGLGGNVQPLRIPDKQLETLRGDAAKPNEMWLFEMLHAGYSLKPHTLKTGESSTALFRGPFFPPLANGPNTGTILQVPRWGFLLRSTAVTAFSDMRVDAKRSNGIKEVL